MQLTLPCLARVAVERVKPDAAHLLAALRVAECPAGQAVMVGEHPMDITAGRAGRRWPCPPPVASRVGDSLRAADAALRGVAACIFDLDGTLVTGPYDFRAMREEVWAAARRHGWTHPFDLSLPALEVIDFVRASGELTAERAARFAAAAHAALDRIEGEWLPRCRPVPGAGEAVRALQAAGLQCVVITRNSARSAAALLAQLAVEAPCLPREAVARVKPDPAHLLAALAAVGGESKDAVMIGDHPMDISAGRACAMRTVGVLTGSGTAESLRAAGADLVLDSVAALPGALLGVVA